MWSEVLIRHLAVQFLEGSTQRQPRTTGALMCRDFQKPYSETNSENENPVFRHRNSCPLSERIQTLSNRKWNSENLAPLQAKKNLLKFLTGSSQARVFLKALPRRPLLGSPCSSSCEPRQASEEAGSETEYLADWKRADLGALLEPCGSQGDRKEAE